MGVRMLNATSVVVMVFLSFASFVAFVFPPHILPPLN